MNNWFALSAAAGSLLALFGCSTQSQSPPAGLVIADVTVVSPERAAPLQHAHVRILDSKILEVSERPLRGEQQIDGRGRYLIPGLIDSHVHLAVPPGFPSAMTAEQAVAHPEVVATTLAQDPKSYLFFGFTTVVDLVGSADRTAQWNGQELRPDAYFCGAAAIINGQLRPIRYPFFSYPVSLEERLLTVSDPAQRTPGASVGRMAAEGAACVKTLYDGFVGVTPTVDEVKGLVAAAHARGMPVFMHANRKRAQAVAVAAGVDVIAHGMWRERGEQPALDAEAHEILSTIARNGTGYQPTTQVIIGELDMLDDDYLMRSQVTDAYPAAFIDWCAREKNECGADRFRSAGAELSIRGTIARAAEVTRVLAKADAHLLFGSDTPSDMLYTNPPGLNGRLEMNNWIAAGVSEEKLFRALTIDNARMLHLDDKIGTVEQGKTANLLLLRANPLKSVTAFDTVETVFLHGRPIPRGELSARKAPLRMQ
jgi:imidazolonepropionase-like amidohydrolase